MSTIKYYDVIIDTNQLRDWAIQFGQDQYSKNELLKMPEYYLNDYLSEFIQYKTDCDILDEQLKYYDVMVDVNKLWEWIQHMEYDSRIFHRDKSMHMSTIGGKITIDELLNADKKNLNGFLSEFLQYKLKTAIVTDGSN